MKELTTCEKAQLQKLIREGKAALNRIEANLVKVEERLAQK